MEKLDEIKMRRDHLRTRRGTMPHPDAETPLRVLEEDLTWLIEQLETLRVQRIGREDV